MPEQPQPEKRVPLGEPLKRSDEDLDRLSEITLQDVEEAQALVRRNATPRGRALWDAQPDDAT